MVDIVETDFFSPNKKVKDNSITYTRSQSFKCVLIKNNQTANKIFNLTY